MAVNPLMTQLMIIPICLHEDHNMDFKEKNVKKRKKKIVTTTQMTETILR